MNEPIYPGQVILDISKTLIYEFWYDYIKPLYGNKVKLCYTDKDSYIMSINADDIYADICNDVKKRFDTSNFDKNDNRPFLIGENKKVLGKFKFELGGKIISEICGLKAKAYSIKLDNDNYEIKKAKGTKKCVVKSQINFDNYVSILFNNKKLIRSQFTFKSDHHKIYTQKINQIALNYFDEKRIQCNDKITTYPYGYFDNKKDINMQIKDSTVMLNAIDNSGIIPNYYNTKDPIKNIASATIDINKIIAINSAKSTCIDNTKSTTNYADSGKRKCIDIIISTNVNNNYLDIIKSTNVNNKYIDSIKSKFIDKKHKNISTKSAYSIVTGELNALLKSKKVTNKNIITRININIQDASIKHELSMLSKLKKVTNKSKDVINFLNKQIYKILSSSCDKDIITKVHHTNIKKAPKHNNDINNAHKEHKKTFKKVLIKIKSCNKAHKQVNNIPYDPQKCKKEQNDCLIK